MKKIIFAIALVMTMGLCANAQDGFFYNWDYSMNDRTEDPSAPDFTLPSFHGYDNDTPAPLGSGLIILGALGTGYAVARKRKK